MEHSNRGLLPDNSTVPVFPYTNQSRPCTCAHNLYVALTQEHLEIHSTLTRTMARRDAKSFNVHPEISSMTHWWRDARARALHSAAPANAGPWCSTGGGFKAHCTNSFLKTQRYFKTAKPGRNTERRHSSLFYETRFRVLTCRA